MKFFVKGRVRSTNNGRISKFCRGHNTPKLAGVCRNRHVEWFGNEKYSFTVVKNGND